MMKWKSNNNYRKSIDRGWLPVPLTTMKLISWNIWGLGNDRAFQELKRILHEQKLEIIFLCETKLKVQLMNRKAEAFNFQNCLAVDSYRKEGGLAMK